MVSSAREAFAFVVVATLALQVRAFSFTLASPPSQCKPFTLAWTEGTAPYSVLIVPVGVTHGPELRTIVDRQGIAGTSWTLDSFAFPTGSKFVVMLSDAKGTGTGGTSDVITMGNGTSSDCLATAQVKPKFYLYQNPAYLSECGIVNLSWDTVMAQRPVTLLGIIPGGNSFNYTLPLDPNAFVQWTVNLKAGTGLMVVAGDKRGRGTGGSTDVQIVQPGTTGCLNSTSPSSTAGKPAGQTSYISGLLSSTTLPSSPSPSSTPDAAVQSRGMYPSLIASLLFLFAVSALLV